MQSTVTGVKVIEVFVADRKVKRLVTKWPRDYIERPVDKGTAA